MRGVNKAIIIGTCGQDPETRYLPNGNAVTNVTVATNEAWKDKDGNKQERTEWHRVCFFGKVAEIAGQYLRKGAQVYIEGKLQTRKWQGQDGQDRYTTEIIVDMQGTMQLLGGKPDGQTQQQPRQQAQRPQQQASQPPAGDSFDPDLDIPF